MLMLLEDKKPDARTSRAQVQILTTVRAVIIHGRTPERVLDRLATGMSCIMLLYSFTHSGERNWLRTMSGHRSGDHGALVHEEKVSGAYMHRRRT